MGSPNPAYGSGVFRRRLHWRAAEGLVEVELEDSNHGFRLQLRHDGSRIVDVAVEPVRFPFTTCPEAVQSVRKIIGLPLADSAAALRERLTPSENCTHMIDMALLAASHVDDSGAERLYDIAVVDECDERDGVTQARIDCDGQRVHEWAARAHVLTAPTELAGRPVMRGFYSWVVKAFSGMPLEAAQVLQRGYFVAQARRYSYLPIEEHPAITDGMPVGSCYSYNTGAVERALRIKGSVRDYSKSSERLLQFADAP